MRKDLPRKCVYVNFVDSNGKYKEVYIPELPSGEYILTMKGRNLEPIVIKNINTKLGLTHQLFLYKAFFESAYVSISTQMEESV